MVEEKYQTPMKKNQVMNIEFKEGERLLSEMADEGQKEFSLRLTTEQKHEVEIKTQGRTQRSFRITRIPSSKISNNVTVTEDPENKDIVSITSPGLGNN